jgi:serine/threonine protein kinase
MTHNDAMSRFRLFLYGSMDPVEIQQLTQDDVIILNNFFTTHLLDIDLNFMINSNTPKIGRGGSGVVYSVQPGNLAVKVLNIPQYTYRIIKNNIITYIKVLLNCDPKRFFCNLLGISTYTTNGKTSLAIITDYCGESLSDTLRKPENIPFNVMREIMIDIVTAIGQMHLYKIAHLDIKPDNILIYKMESGHLIGKLIDFGLSQDWSPLDEIPTALFYGTSCFVDKYARDKLKYPYTLPNTEPTNVDNRTHSPNIIQMDVYALARTFMFLYSDNTQSTHYSNNCIQKLQQIKHEYAFFQRLGICILYKLNKKRLGRDELVLKVPEDRMNLADIFNVLVNPDQICHIERLEPPYFMG